MQGNEELEDKAMGYLRNEYTPGRFQKDMALGKELHVFFNDGLSDLIQDQTLTVQGKHFFSGFKILGFYI